MNIVQFGCVGTRNYGDEVSALNIRKMLRDIYPDAEFSIIGGEKHLLEFHHPDVKGYAPRTDKAKILHLCKQADLFVYGAGTILTQNFMIRNPWLVHVKCPILIWGVGCGHVTPDIMTFASRASILSVRDNSIQHVADAGLDAVNVHDPMLMNGVPGQQKLHNAVCISWGLSKQPKPLQSRVLKQLAEIIKADTSKEWVALPAAWDGETIGNYDDDRYLHKKLKKLCPVRVVTPDSFEHLDQLVSQSAKILTSRLHIGVAGFGASVPVFWFGPEKNKVMAESLGVPTQYIGNYKNFKTIPAEVTPPTGDWGLETQTQQMKELLTKVNLV